MKRKYKREYRGRRSEDSEKMKERVIRQEKGREGNKEGTVHYSTVHYSTVQYSTVQYSTVHYSTVQYSTVQYSTVQYSTVQYSTVQYSTVQYSTVQYSTVQYCAVHCVPVDLSPLLGMKEPSRAIVNACHVMHQHVVFHIIICITFHEI